jgi:hypothetical protein
MKITKAKITTHSASNGTLTYNVTNPVFRSNGIAGTLSNGKPGFFPFVVNHEIKDNDFFYLQAYEIVEFTLQPDCSNLEEVK